jgi:hypothetical protein
MQMENVDTTNYTKAEQAMIDQVEQLARNFSSVLKGWLTGEELSEAIRLNKEEDDHNVCHSHDFCDANMAMHEAFVNLYGREFTFYDEEIPESDRISSIDTMIWNRAWSIAKENEFFTIVPISLDNYETYISSIATQDTGGNIYNDVIVLKDGSVIRISENAVCVFKNAKADEENDPIAQVMLP